MTTGIAGGKVAEIEIDGCTYQVTKMLGTDGARFAMRTAPYLFPFFSELMNLAAIAKGGGKVSDAQIGPALLNMIRAMNGPETDYLNDTLGKLTQVCWTDNGQPYSRTLDKAFFDQQFQDRLDLWIEWLVFALKAQLGSFFAGALKLGAKLQSNVPAPQTTTSVSNTQSPSPAGTPG